MPQDQDISKLTLELAKLEHRREKALGMGGPEKIKRQHDLGKLTARERVDLLIDKGTFQEYGQLATCTSDRPQMAGQFTAADAVITGFGRIDGRMCGVVAEDFTVKGGSVGSAHFLKKLRLSDMALREQVPVVWLLDGAGARAEEAIAEGLPACSCHLAMAKLSGIAPQVAVVMGPCAGDSSLIASFMEFIVMVKGTSMLAAGGPPVVLRALGLKVTKEELGGWHLHCVDSGVADNPAENDHEAIMMARQYLSYLPRNAYEYPASIPSQDDIGRMEEELLTILPENPKRPYDMKRLIELVVDKDSFFEIKPLYAPEIIIGFARMNGHSIGIIANQPMHLAGSITAKAAQKERHFIDLCNAYHVPLLFIQDIPGVMTGPDSEREAALRHGLAVLYSLSWADVPKITLIVHKAFGFGSEAMCGYGCGQTVTLAWPGADFGSLPADSGVLAAYGAQIAKSDDPAALKKILEESFEAYSGSLYAAARYNIDDVIDPRETRFRIIRALELSMSRRIAQPCPVLRHGVMP